MVANGTLVLHMSDTILDCWLQATFPVECLPLLLFMSCVQICNWPYKLLHVAVCRIKILRVYLNSC